MILSSLYNDLTRILILIRKFKFSFFLLFSSSFFFFFSKIDSSDRRPEYPPTVEKLQTGILFPFRKHCTRDEIYLYTQGKRAPEIEIFFFLLDKGKTISLLLILRPKFPFDFQYRINLCLVRVIISDYPGM